MPEIRGLKELRLKEVTWEGRGVFLLLRWCRGGLRRCELEGFSMGDEEVCLFALLFRFLLGQVKKECGVEKEWH